MVRYRKCRDLSVIIPAAGMGRRMKSHGPKSLIDLASRETVIERQIRLIRSSFPAAEIVVVVGYEAERIIRRLPNGIKIVENENYQHTNVIRSIGMGLRVVSHNNLLLVYGDLVFNAAAISWAARGGSAVLVDSRGQIGEHEVGVAVVQGRVTNFSYGLQVKWAQIAYLTGRELDLFRKFTYNVDKHRYFGFEGLNSVVDNGGRIYPVEPREMRIAEIDCSRDVESVRRVDSRATHSLIMV